MSCNSVCKLNQSLIFSGFFIIPYVVSSIGPQLLEETTGFHINKYLALILGPAILLAIAGSLGSTFAPFLSLFIIPLFILMVKIVNEHFLGNSSWIYAIAIPAVIYLTAYYVAKSREDRPSSEDPTFLESLPYLYLVVLLLLHIYIYFILGKNYKLLN